MTKIHIELSLKSYSKMELMELLKLKILTPDEVKSELLSRGMSEWSIVTMIRTA